MLVLVNCFSYTPSGSFSDKFLSSFFFFFFFWGGGVVSFLLSLFGGGEGVGLS